MRTLIFFLFILLLADYGVNAQTLVVGEYDPDEIKIIDGETSSYDTIRLLNNSLLMITNSNITIDFLLEASGTSTLNVFNGKFTVNGMSSFINNSTLYFSDSLEFNGYINIKNSCHFNIDSAYFYMDMDYNYQYYVFVEDSAEFSITNSTIAFKKGKLGGSFSNHTYAILENLYFFSPVTFIFQNETQAEINNCHDPVEFIFHDSCRVDISDSKGFILWFGIDSGAIADIYFPPPTCSNGATNIASYTFSSDSIPGLNGVFYTINIDNTDTVYFATMQEENSDVTIDNPFIFGCGFNFSSGQHHVSGIYNDSTYYSLYADFEGSSISLDSSSVFTWNFYPSSYSEVFFDNTVFGELVTYEYSKAYIRNSMCDGHGTKLGAYNHSEIYAYDSRFIRGLFMYSHPIMINKNYSFSALYNCEITGDFIVSDLAKLYLANTVHDRVPTLYFAAYVLDVFLDSIPDAYINSTLAITGILNEYKTFLTPKDLTGYEVGYSNTDSTNYISLGMIPYTLPITEDTIYTWNTNGMAAGNYLFWVTAFVNGDSAISANRPVLLDELTNVPEIQFDDFTYQVYPNPFHDYTVFSLDPLICPCYSVEVYDILGKFIAELHENGSGHVVIKKNEIFPGMYLYKIKCSGNVLGNGKLIIE